MTVRQRQPRTSPAHSARLQGVDGLRAAAALWVVLFHIRSFSGARLTGVPGLDLAIRSGSTGVSLFLVLSGFCLYVPYAGGAASKFRTGSFLARRCRRLMPAYYVSLIIIAVIYVLLGGSVGLPRWGAGRIGEQLAAHALLIHQLTPATFYGFNGAYWSLGLEWELYLTLPLLVWAALRIGLARTVPAVVGVTVVYRLGLAAAIAGHAIAPGSALATDVLPNLFIGRWSEFAFGMVAAELYRTGRVEAWSRRLRYLALPLVPLAVLTVGNPLSHILFGGVFFLLLCVVLAGDNFVSKLFAWRPLAVIGVMSYSLYLVHQPLVQILAAVLAGAGASHIAVFLELVALIPVLLVAAAVLFVLVERHSLPPRTLAELPFQPLLNPKGSGWRWWRRRPAVVADGRSLL